MTLKLPSDGIVENHLVVSRPKPLPVPPRAMAPAQPKEARDVKMLSIVWSEVGAHTGWRGTRPARHPYLIDGSGYD